MKVLLVPLALLALSTSAQADVPPIDATNGGDTVVLDATTSEPTDTGSATDTSAPIDTSAPADTSGTKASGSDDCAAGGGAAALWGLLGLAARRRARS